tara:strand:+ start:8157 stop:9812 length:1656 start_codon:yes stop_codon:yes gene_type:complete
METDERTTDDLISEALDKTGLAGDPHLISPKDANKIGVLRTLFVTLENDFVSERDWYVNPSRDVWEEEKSGLYELFANCLFTEPYRGQFRIDPRMFYNANSGTAGRFFWEAVCRVLEEPEEPEPNVLRFKLVIQPWNTLVRKNSEGNFTLELGGNFPNWTMKVPGEQRTIRWSPSKNNDFIQSLNLGMPIPSITVFMNEERGVYEILDGQQRLEATISSLDEIERLPDEVVVGVYVVRAEEASEDKVREALVNLYWRLNTGGVNLKPIEARVGLYYHKKLLQELISLCKEILSSEDGDADWKLYIRQIYDKKKLKKNNLRSEALNANEIDLVDLLLRPIVYGQKDGSGQDFEYIGLSTMKGVERLLSGPRKIEDDMVTSTLERLRRSFEMAFRTFNDDDCGYLRMAATKDSSGEVGWQKKGRLDKTGAALQVGAFYSNPNFRIINDDALQSLRTDWLDFNRREYLGDDGKPRRQNSGNLWKWQTKWVEDVRTSLEGLVKEGGVEMLVEGSAPTESEVDELRQALNRTNDAVVIRLLESRIEELEESLNTQK